MLGLVFSLCGTAQTVAGLQALEAAQNQIVSVEQAAARDLLREAEMLSQTIIRVFMDWPRLLDQAPAAQVVRDALSMQVELEKLLFAGMNWKVCGGVEMMPNVEALRLCVIELQNQLNLALSPGELTDQLLVALDDQRLNGFGALTAGENPETGALSRQWSTTEVAKARDHYGAGLRVRLLARLADLRDLPRTMLNTIDKLGPCEANLDDPTPEGEGSATVETSRGALTHNVSIQNGKIYAYSIEAPTDVNFLNDGVVATGLMGADATNLEALKRAAELHVLAVDPCVRCALEINHA